MNTNNCLENFSGLPGSITVIPDEAIDFYYPVSERKKVLDASYFVCDYQRTFPLITKRKSIQVSEGVGASLSGDVYNVKVAWRVDVPDEKAAADAVAQFERLENGLNHLLIKSVDDHRALLRVHEGAFDFHYIEKEGYYECTFEAQSASGLQRIPMN